MHKMRVFLVLIVLSLAVGACQNNPAPAATAVTVASEPALSSTPAPQEGTVSPADKLKTAAAKDQATLAAGPTRPPTSTPVPIPTIDPNQNYWWNDRVFYEIFVRSFKDSDGDGIGDFNGLTSMLDYLNDGDPETQTDLGITGIWLMPITESPSYHGYDVVDYFAVDEEYGTEEDFARFLSEAHKRGINVIIDLVLNHTSSQHTWFQQSKDPTSPYRDWYIWSDTDPGFPGPWGQQVWYESNGAYYYAVFWSEMPDLNLMNPDVTAILHEAARFWLEEMDVDGFRMDAIIHYIENGQQQSNSASTHAWLGDFHRFYKSVDPDAFVVGEAWTDTGELLDYTADETDVVFAFDLAQDFIATANGGPVRDLQNRMTSMVTGFPPGQYATFLANHDQNRVMSQLRDINSARLAAVLLLTSPGVPFLYYGEEIGMQGVKPDEDIRRPMQWSSVSPGAGFTDGTPWRPPASDYPTVNVNQESADRNSLLRLYRALIHLRTDHPALSTGDWRLVDSSSSELYAFLRSSGDENILVVVNKGSKTVSAGDYALSLSAGPLSAGVQAEILLGLADPSDPVITAQGGFDSYVPFEEIQGKSFAVVNLAAAR